MCLSPQRERNKVFTCLAAAMGNHPSSDKQEAKELSSTLEGMIDEEVQLTFGNLKRIGWRPEPWMQNSLGWKTQVEAISEINPLKAYGHLTQQR